MNKIAPFILIVFVVITLMNCTSTQNSTEWSGLTTAKDSLSYAIGVSVAQNIKAQGIDELNSAAVTKAIEDTYAGTQLMETKDADGIVRTAIMEIREKRIEETKKKSTEWLEENATKEGVVSLPSGLQYKVLREGEGASPDGNDIVTVHYEGRLINGEIFDSSYDKGVPMTRSLAQVIRGWTEGVPMMKKGGMAELYIPYDLGYGGREAPGGDIPAYSTLIFKVELLDFETVE